MGEWVCHVGVSLIKAMIDGVAKINGDDFNQVLAGVNENVLKKMAKKNL